MINIAIIQEAGHHKENAHLRECFCLKRAFELCGDVENVRIWGKGHFGFDDDLDWNRFDIIVNIENYSHNWMPDLSKTTRPMKFMWSIDSHVVDVHPCKTVFDMGKYHYFLQATSMFTDRVPNSIWFPNAYDDTQLEASHVPIKDRKVPIGFCGSTLNRKKMCDEMKTRIPGFQFDHWKLGQAMMDCIQSYRIHFNLNYNWDINYRNLETCGLGTVLLTNNDMNFKDYDALGFEHGVNCLFWNSKKSETMFDVYNEWSGNLDGLQQIANAGSMLVSSKHTYYNRIKDIIRIYNGEKLDAATLT